MQIEPQIDLEFEEGEHILYTARRHWIVLFQRGFIFLIIGVAAALLTIYRAVGGTFIAGGVVAEGQLDFVGVVLLALTLVLIGLWWLPQRGKDKKKKSRLGLRDLPYLLGVLVLSLAFFFRFQGGRIFYIDPLEDNGGDALNLLLILLALLMLAILIYIVIDWANDFLILTNTRVIYDDQQLLVRHVVQQVLIENVQQVVARAETYPEHWLGYGTLVIRSLSPRRLVFSHADRPQIMLQRILDEVNKLRKQKEPELLRLMIEDQVYGNKAPPAPALAVQVEERRGPLPWFFSVNPEIDYAREIVIWRPFWIFLVLAMARPLLILFLSGVIFVFLARLGVIGGAVLFVLWLPIALFCLGWIFWIREEHEHDLYILTRQDITDVDKKPFGPESRRRAPLGAIQDISYDVGYIENILGFGDVIIETGGAGGGGKFTFQHVPDPRGVEATINDYLTDFRKREKERQLQDTIALLRQYHQAQRDHDELIDDQRLAALITSRLTEETAQRQLADQAAREAREPAGPLPQPVRREVRGIVRRELARWRRRQRPET